MIKQSFIFPIHNEEEVLVSQLKLFFGKVIPLIGKEFEVILIENGSKDNTADIALKLANKFKCIKYSSLNFASYGQAIKEGISLSTGKQIFILNIDYYDVDFIKKAIVLLPYIDIVIGSKTLSSSQDKRSLLRRLTTYFFNVFLRLVLNFPGTDTHGIKAFANTPFFHNMISRCRTKNELFDTELVIRMTHNGALFVDLPQRVLEIRPSRYKGMRRIVSTIQDILIALDSKYLTKRKFKANLVDADDFGISKEVNQAIMDQVKSKKVNIVSIMANLVDAKSLDLLKKSKQLSYSLHFNLLRGKPLSKTNDVKSLVNGKGKFYPLYIFISKLLLGKINLNEVINEFRAQYNRLKNNGLDIKYINSEQHLHIFSPINRIIEKEKVDSVKIRSVSSTVSCLKRKPFRFCVFLGLRLLLSIKYFYFKEFKQKYNSYIVHPGTNYDR